eukprot:1908293-Pleurochrysis_carterae.AAC.1
MRAAAKSSVDGSTAARGGGRGADDEDRNRSDESESEAGDTGKGDGAGDNNDAANYTGARDESSKRQEDALRQLNVGTR